MANLKYIGKNILNHTLEIKKGDVSGSSTSTGSFGSVHAGSIYLNDNNQIKLGDSNELEIFHNGSNNNSIIQDTGIGNLVIKGSNLFLQSATNENFFKGTANGSVELYHDDVKKFETTADGIAITGSVDVSGSIYLNDGEILYAGDGNDLQIYHSGVTGNIKNTTGTLVLQSGTVRLQDAGSSETALSTANGIATLYYLNSEVLSTTADGISMTGKITNLSEPTASQDAATKAYVDVSLNGSISGSAQIASDVSGSWRGELSSSVYLQNVKTTISGSLGSNATLIRSLTAAGISGSVTSVSSSLASRITTAETELGNTLISSSAQIADDISGSFTSTSSSLASRITTEEGNVDTLQARNLIAGDGLTGGGTLAADRTFNIGAGTGITVNANDIAVSAAQTSITSIINNSLGKIGTSDDHPTAAYITFGTSNEINTFINNSERLSVRNGGIDVTGVITSTGNISGSSTSTGSFGKVIISELSNSDLKSVSSSISTRLTTAETELGNTLISSSAQIADDISGSFTAGTGLDLSSGQFSVDVSDFMSNGANNRVLTATGTDAINAEANLTFDGSTLNVVGDVSSSSTSTGSFGNLRIAGNSAFGDLSFDTFPYNSNSNSGQFLTLKAQDTTGKAILELASANVSSNNVVGEIHFINRSGGAAFNPIANITSHFSQGLLFKTQYGNNGEKVGIRITEENNAPPEVIIPSGSLEVKGNVSGSSTSTGSFGSVHVPDKIGIGTTAPNSMLHVDGGDIRLSTNEKIYFHDTSDYNYLHFHAGRLTLGYTADAIQIDMNGSSVKTIEMQANSDFRLLGRSNKDIILEPQGTGIVHIKGAITGSSLDVSGNIRAVGDVIAERYIVSSSVTFLTQSFSSGSTIFGDTTDDTHQFTGSLKIHSGSIDINSSSSPNYAILGKSSTGKEYFKIRNSNSESFPIGRLQLSYSDSNTSMISAGSNQLRYIGGENTSAGSHIFLAGNNTTEIAKFRGSDGLTVSLGNISGSSTSTGSFGAGYIDNKLGIGTSSPSYELHTTGDTFTTEKFLILQNKLIQSRNSVGAGNFGNSIKLKNSSTGNMEFTLENDAYDFTFTNGKVGIGTTTPTEKLYVAGNIFATENISGSSTSTGSFGRIFSADSANIAGLEYPTADADDGSVFMTNGSGVITLESNVKYVNVKNVETHTLSKGTPVHATGTSGNTPEVVAASASISTKMPATFVLAEQLTAGSDGRAVLSGFLNGIDTSTCTEGNILYVGADGGYTKSKPTGSANLIQNIAIVGKVDASNGSIFVNDSGRAVDVPNLPTGKIWVGNANTVTSSIVYLDEPGAELQVTGSILSTGNISGSSTSTGSFGVIRAGSGVNKFGTGTSDTHIFTGSLSVNGNVTLPSTSHKIGIGITPTSTLHVGGGSSRSLLVDSTSGTTQIISRKDGNQIRLLANGSNPILGYGHTGGSARNLLITSNDTTVATFTSGGDLLMSDGNDISGSATSTGSFGDGHIAGKLGIGTTSHLSNRKLTVSDGHVQIDAGRFYYLTTAGYGVSYSSNQALITGFNGLKVQAWDSGLTDIFSVTKTKISGSSTSTGSFGRVVSADGVFEGAGSKKLIIDSNSNISLGNNDLGTSNTLFGYQAGNFLVAGSNQNTAIGTQALLYAGSADTDGNTAVGFQSMFGSSAGSVSDKNPRWNTAIGYQSLKVVTTGDNNVALGYQSGIAVSTGPRNTIIGNGAGGTITAGENNILIGSGADVDAAAGSNRIGIGYNVSVDADHKTVIGASTQTVVEFGGDALISGSATSTGSFGAVSINGSPNIHGDSDGIGLGITNPAKDFHIHGSIPTVRLTAGGFTSGVDFLMDTGGTGYIGNRNNGKIQIFTNGTATVDFLANQNTFFYGNISGSSTSTGSFGAIETPGVITSDGRVNITDGSMGINTQGSKLLIDAGTHNYPIRFTRSSTSGNFVQVIQETAANSTGIILTSPSNNNIGMNIAWNGGTNVGHIVIKRASSSYGILGRFELAVRHNSVRNDVLHIGHHRQTSLTFDHTKMSMELLSGSLHVVNGNISGSATSTGSFGRVEATTVSASKYIGQIGSRYVHSQTSDSATWTINHNIGSQYPVVTVYNTDDQMILPEQGTATDSDTFTLTFSEAIQGKAVVSVGGIGTNAGGNYIHVQSDSSTNWNVTHSLSQQYPNITVFDENDEVILPETITALDDNHSTITFSSGKTGYANFSIGSGIPNITHANAGKVLKVRSDGTGVEWSPTSNDVSGSMSVSGSITPTIDNFHDLGSASYRWANLYTGDIQLSNEGSEGNEVDGTTGSWTIQEGEDDLYLLNRKNGKKYKFKLEEIT